MQDVEEDFTELLFEVDSTAFHTICVVKKLLGGVLEWREPGNYFGQRGILVIAVKKHTDQVECWESHYRIPRASHDLRYDGVHLDWRLQTCQNGSCPCFFHFLCCLVWRLELSKVIDLIIPELNRFLPFLELALHLIDALASVDVAWNSSLECIRLWWLERPNWWL